MGMLFKPSWWISMIVSTLMTMVFIYLIKRASAAMNIPIVSTIANEV